VVTAFDAGLVLQRVGTADERRPVREMAMKAGADHIPVRVERKQAGAAASCQTAAMESQRPDWAAGNTRALPAEAIDHFGAGDTIVVTISCAEEERPARARPVRTSVGNHPAIERLAALASVLAGLLQPYHGRGGGGMRY